MLNKNIKLFLVLIGLTFQCYSYSLLSVLALEVGRSLLVSKTSSVDLTEILKQVFGVIAISVWLKPFISYFIGKIGDVKGIKHAAKISWLVSGTSVAIFGLIPSYDLVGNLSIVLFITLRLIMVGFFTSGLDSIKIFIFEAFKKKGYAEGIISVASMTGPLLASIAAYLINVYNDFHYGWRIAFILGGTMNIALLMIMLKYNILVEPVRAKKEELELYKSMSLAKIALKHYKVLILTILIMSCQGGMYQFLSSFIVNYISSLLKIIPITEIKLHQNTMIMFYMISSVVAGILYECVSSRRILMATIAIIVILSASYILFGIFNNKFEMMSYFLMGCSLGGITTLIMAEIKSIIPKVIRCRMFGLCHAVGSALVSGPTCFYCMYLYKKSNKLPMVYFLSLILICITSYFTLSYISKKNERNKEIV